MEGEMGGQEQPAIDGVEHRDHLIHGLQTGEGVVVEAIDGGGEEFLGDESEVHVDMRQALGGRGEHGDFLLLGQRCRVKCEGELGAVAVLLQQGHELCGALRGQDEQVDVLELAVERVGIEAADEVDALQGHERKAPTGLGAEGVEGLEEEHRLHLLLEVRGCGVVGSFHVLYGRCWRCRRR